MRTGRRPADGESVRAGLVDRRAACGDAVPLATPATGGRPPPQPARRHPRRDPHLATMSVAFGIDTFRNGMDPLAILNYVRGLGTITARSSARWRRRAALDEADAESCHLAFAFRVESTATARRDRRTFSFVRDD